MTAFQRAYRLNVGGIEIDASEGVGLRALRMLFSVERDDKRHPNNAEIKIYNLTRAHQAALAKAPEVRVRLEAGYVGELGTIFDGDLRSARSKREGPDIVTTISGGDGEAKIRTARINKTFSAGTPVATVIGELGKALGVGAGNLRDFAGAKLGNGSRTLTRSMTLSGPVFDELEHVCRSCGLRWSVQDSALQLRHEGLPVGDRQGPLLRPDSGLIGEVEVETKTSKKSVWKVSASPEQQAAAAGVPLSLLSPDVSIVPFRQTEQVIATTTTRVSGACLLRTDLIPGVPFRVESEAWTGNLVCQSTVHSGDTHSPSEWSVSWTGKAYK
jgi:hypothetical protein